MVIYVLIFLVVNTFITFLFSPEQGVEIYGTRHVMFKLFGPYTLTQEQLFYQITKLFKYALGHPVGDYLPADHQPERVRVVHQQGGGALQGRLCLLADPALLPGCAARLSRYQPGAAGARTGDGRKGR